MGDYVTFKRHWSLEFFSSRCPVPRLHCYAVEAQQFSWSNGLEQGPTALKMSQNIDKSMAYITNKSGGDF